MFIRFHCIWRLGFEYGDWTKMRREERNTIEIDEKTPLMLLMGPMFIEMLLGIVLNNVDQVMLSRYSDTASGAVGNANQIMFLMIIMFNIIATSTSIVVAQYLGAKKYEAMNTIYTLAMTVNLLLGVVLSAGLVLLRNPIMNLLNVPDSMKKDCGMYILIVGGGLFFQACCNVMNQILRCNGFAKVGMYISLIVNVINIFGNFTFLYGPLSFLKLGVAGVGISTVVSRFIALMIAIAIFYFSKMGRLSLKYIKPFPTAMLVQMIKIGLPSAGENLSYNLYQLVLLSFINRLGEVATNAKVFCATIMSFTMVFSNTAAMSTQIITGHLIGAGKEDAAYKRVFSTLKISLPITVAMATINWLLSPFTLKLLFEPGEEVLNVAFFIMAVDIFIEFGRCLNMTFVNSLKAAGDYLFPLYVGLFTMWGIGVSVGYISGILMGIGVAGIYIGTASDEIIRGIIVLQRWRKQKWRGKAIVSK